MTRLVKKQKNGINPSFVADLAEPLLCDTYSLKYKEGKPTLRGGGQKPPLPPS